MQARKQECYETIQLVEKLGFQLRVEIPKDDYSTVENFYLSIANLECSEKSLIQDSIAKELATPNPTKQIMEWKALFVKTFKSKIPEPKRAVSNNNEVANSSSSFKLKEICLGIIVVNGRQPVIMIEPENPVKKRWLWLAFVLPNGKIYPLTRRVPGTESMVPLYKELQWTIYELRSIDIELRKPCARVTFKDELSDIVSHFTEGQCRSISLAKAPQVAFFGLNSVGTCRCTKSTLWV